jgi:FdhD protein
VTRPVSVDVTRIAVGPDGTSVGGTRRVPEETAVALNFNGTGYAVMMATPSNLEDFGVGFALTEGIIETAADVESIEAVDLDVGIELRLWIAEDRMHRLAERRRRMAGPVGCGLCGIESLEAAMRTVPPVTADFTLSIADVVSTVALLAPMQPLGRATRAVHAAFFWRPRGPWGPAGLVSREDVGRHNALDKLVGALTLGGIAAATGVVVVTSRLSVEMVQKTAVAGAGVLVAVSAPTALAIRAADAAGMTLIGIARGAEFEVFTHPWRVRDLPAADTPPPADTRSADGIDRSTAPAAEASRVA